MNPTLTLLCSVLLLAGMAAGTALATVDFDVEGAGRSYGPGDQYLNANVTVSYNELMPKDTASLYIGFDSESVPRGQVSLQNYLHEESYYTFQNQSFNYNLTAEGIIEWYDYPSQYFDYMVSVQGLCGGSWCYPADVDYCQCPVGCYPIGGSDYPCSWTISGGFEQGVVNGDPDLTGLKFIKNASQTFGIPLDAIPETVVWQVQEGTSNPAQVDVAMMAACGLKSTPDPLYDSQTVWESGWIIRTILSDSKPCPEILSGTTTCRVVIFPFTDASMNSGYTRFGGPPAGYPGGGIYKTNDFVTNQYQQRGSDANWNGTTGEILIVDYDPDAQYDMVYLPPNGPLVCAYTSHGVPNSDSWRGYHEIKQASAGYMKPYIRTFTLTELQYLSGLQAPDCPIPPESQYRCDKEDVVYGATETYDPSGSVAVSFDSPTLTVNGTVDKKVFTGTESFDVELLPFLIDISDITQSIGNHTMDITITDGIITYGQESFSIFTCADADQDGYCTENGDCNDTNPDLHPGATEECNGVDDDCNGIIDDGIVGMGEQLGKTCMDWPGSICNGTYVCNTNGTGLVCLPENGIYPGDYEEVCINAMDDDCDGAVDEKEGDVIEGIIQPACLNEAPWCIKGQTRPCGQCRDGVSSCSAGVWQPCVGGSSPTTEVCNAKDDDCDRVVDNIRGGSSIEETNCGCYGGSSPSSEICNDIDDDCNGVVDDGTINCCVDGNTRTCGSEAGECEFGIQTCVGGSWAECVGSTDPVPEVCCDELDNNCDGDVDEGCSRAACDEFNQSSMIYWIMMGLGVMILIGVIIYTEFIKKKKGQSAYQT